MKIYISALALLWSANAYAESFDKDVDAMNLCVYHLGLRFFGESPKRMREMVISTCKPQIDQVGVDDDNKKSESHVVKFFLNDFMSMYEKALRHSR